MYLADDDWLMNYYGIDASLLSDYVFAEADEVHADRVIMLKVKDTADVPAMTEKLQAVLDQLSSPEMLSYLPDQEDIITSASRRSEQQQGVGGIATAVGREPSFGLGSQPLLFTLVGHLPCVVEIRP